MRQTVVILTIIALFVGCDMERQRQDQRLEAVLNYAGENRTELEKVLAHYDKSLVDSLKYRAARFLVENMPGHYSYRDTAYLNAYYDEIDSVAVIYKDRDDAFKDSMFRQVKAKYNNQPSEYIEDIHFVTADYLIDNIERAFSVWQNDKWATHVEFDDFCEYILPYKVVETQELDGWRKYFSTYADEELRKAE